MIMKQTLIALAILAVSGAAQAQTYEVVSDKAGVVNLVNLGPTTVGGFHGPIGAPGIAAAGTSDYISLQSIESFTHVSALDQTLAGTSTNWVFTYHQLAPGFIHTEPEHEGEEPLAVGLDGIKIPGLAKSVYFGIASADSATPGLVDHQAWYVGDKKDRVLPSSSTDYVGVALVATPSTAVNAPSVLPGQLTVSSGATSISGQFTAGSGTGKQTLEIAATGGAAFSGTAKYYVGTTAPGATNGTSQGQFFGDAAANASALAGVASGTYLGTGYVASFGARQK